MQNEDDLQNLSLLKKQFLCNFPVKEICWQKFSDLTLHIQDEIIKNTVRLSSVLKYPINLSYQKAFLKNLLQFLESQDSAISDGLYEEYARLVALPHNNINYFKHYPLEGGENLVLKEDVNLITDGTTGLRTWQAALALSEWVLGNVSSFTSKRIIELGSGVGLLGLVLLQCKPHTLYLSDCHPSVLTALCDNIWLNINSDKNHNRKGTILLEEIINCSVVKVLNLPWEQVSKQYCLKLGQVDVIVAADVIYDKTIFEILISAIDNLFKYCRAQKLILSCTERNQDTLENFLFLIEKKYKICDIVVPKQKNFIWEATPPVKIFHIVRSNNG